MARFTSENAAVSEADAKRLHGRRGGQQSYQRSEERFAELVLFDPAAAERVAHLVQAGHRLPLALRVIRLSDKLFKGGR